MKKYIKYLLCALVILTIAFVPEVNDFLFSSSGDILMVGPGFAAMNWPTGRNNMGGFKDNVLFIPATTVSATPVLPADPQNNDELVTAAGTFTFKEAGDKPIYIYCTRNTVKYSAPTQGEDDGVSFAPAGEFFFPGNMKEMHAFNALVKNTPGYLVLEDTDGNQIMVGQPGLPVSIKPSFEGGQAKADRRGTKYEFACDSNYSAIFLASPIDFQTLEPIVVGEP